MKKIHLFAAMLLAAFATAAYATNDSIPKRGGEKDPWYFEIFGGINHSMNENLDEKMKHAFGFSDQSIGAGAFLGYGKEFTPVWGWRGVLAYNSNKGRATFFNKEEKIYSFHDVELFGDITFDLMDAFAPKRRNKRFNLKAFLGVGALQTFGFPSEPLSYVTDYSSSPRLNWGFRAGFNARYRVSEDVCVGMELSQAFIDDHFSGVAGNFPLDSRQNLSVGLVWIFNPKTRLPANYGQVVETEIKPVVNTIVVYKEPESEGLKRRVLEGKAYLDFPVNETIIQADYRKNPSELRKIIESIDVVKLDSTVTITSITIHGYASPEGSYDNNKRLAQGRAEALKRYLMGMYDFNSDIISVTSTPEDWAGLADYVESSNLENKDRLLSIIRNESLHEDRRELEMKNALGVDGYNYILNNVYPGLRHSDYGVNYTVRDYTLDEAKLIITKHPELLSLKEMYQVANSYPRNSYKFNEAMIIAAKQYPDDLVANLNAANASLEANKIDDAKLYLERAGEMPEAIHARGVLEAMKGNYDVAKSLLLESQKKGIAESSNIFVQPVK